MKKTLSLLIYSLASGGAERVVSTLLRELKEEYNITLFLMNNTISYGIPKDTKVVYLENSDSKESGIKKLLKLPILAWKYRNYNKSEISLSFMNRPNYINVLSKLMGMKSKVVISERAMPSLQHQKGLQGLINRILITFLYSKADVVSANSKGNSQDLEKNFKCKNVITITNPLDIPKIESLLNINLKYRDDKFTFITIGRLDDGKNHQLIIKAMKKIDAKLYIIGDGALRNELETLIKENQLEDKVILLGKQQNPYLYISQADCFVFSSNYEGFPNVLLEALACGLPVISTDCQSGPREILAPNSNMNYQLQNGFEKVEYGILTTINDVKSLNEAMQVIIEDKSLKEKYKKEAKNRANDFDVKKIIKKWISVLDC